MKKAAFSLIAAAAMGSFAIAGGDIAPAPVSAPDDSGFYLGLAYSYIDYDLTKTINTGGTAGSADRNTNHNAVMFQAGYQFNSYIAIEGRYWAAGDEDFKVGNLKRTKTLDAYGIYLKPIYPVTDSLNIYGLLGYAHINSSFKAYRPNGTVNDQDLDDNDFSWGLGFSYEINEDWSVFADFVRIYDDKQVKHLAAPLIGNKTWDMTIDSFNVGFTYKF